MDRKKAEERLKELDSQLKYHNKKYFEDDDPEITDEIDNKFQLALDDYQTGMITISYTPAAYLGSQVAAGTNYAILCKANEINKGSKWVIVYFYEDMEENLSVLDIADVDWGM